MSSCSQELSNCRVYFYSCSAGFLSSAAAAAGEVKDMRMVSWGVGWMGYKRRGWVVVGKGLGRGTNGYSQLGKNNNVVNIPK